MSPEQLKQTRYPGVKPFTIEDAPMFFGREKDAQDLFSLIFVKQAVVLYGKSGFGKSSLFNAGITPLLNAEGSWDLNNIRFNYYTEKNEENITPADTMRAHLKDDLPANFLSPLDQLLPAENSFWYWLKTLQFNKKQNKFIFFFDQFEELFTYPKEQIEEFSELLSQLLYNKIPGQFRKKMMEMDKNGTLPEELHDFLYDEPEIKVVFAIRSDRLSLMNGLTDRHPAILQNCFELQALSREEAENAIVKPAQLPQGENFNSPPFEYSREAIDKILDSITNPQDGSTETSTLQIVCRYVEDDLVEEQGHTSITGELLGDITEIFRHYYEGILHKLSDEERVKIQRLIEDELIDGGRRNPLSVSYIHSKFGIEEELLQRLEKTSLLRKERDASGRILYEVSHDSLVEAIESVAKGRRAIEEEQKRLELEKQIDTERKRSEELLAMNKEISEKRKNARKWVGYLTGLSSLALCAVGFALFKNYQTTVANEKVVVAQKQADSAKYNAYQAKLNQQFTRYNNLLYEINVITKGKYSKYDPAIDDKLEEANKINKYYIEPFLEHGLYKIDDSASINNFLNLEKIKPTPNIKEIVQNQNFFNNLNEQKARYKINLVDRKAETAQESAEKGLRWGNGNGKKK